MIFFLHCSEQPGRPERSADRLVPANPGLVMEFYCGDPDVEDVSSSSPLFLSHLKLLLYFLHSAFFFFP